MSSSSLPSDHQNEHKWQAHELAGHIMRLGTTALPSLRRGFSTSAIAARNTPARRPRDPLDKAPNAVRHALPSGETLIVRPPPSMASFAHASTPDLTYVSQEHAGVVSPDSLPPLRPARNTDKADSTLNPDQIAKMRKLRSQNPEIFTVNRLAKQFNCSTYFVMRAAPASRERIAVTQQQKEETKAGWGPYRKLHDELRKERRLLW